MHRKESFLTSLFFNLYSISKRRESSDPARGNPLGSLLKLMLTLAGFGCLTMAGFRFSMIVGLIVAGISCFLLAWIYGSDEPQSANVH